MRPMKAVDILAKIYTGQFVSNRCHMVSHTHTHTHSDRLIVAYCFLQVITQACLCTMKLPAKTLLVT